MVNFADTGWVHFPSEPSVVKWVQHAHAIGRRAIHDPKYKKWLQCQGTWFVGVDVLPNDAQGAVANGPPLQGAAMDWLARHYGPLPLHRGQLSCIWPGYPRPRQGESDAAFRYRRDRDAAHVDGLLAIGENRQRMLKERHAYILGIPLTETNSAASPLVIWEGSHRIIGQIFAHALAPLHESEWEHVDLTPIYHAARREAFESCKRVEISARPGEIYVIHRHALHGIAPWKKEAKAPAEGRMIAYFRPEFPMGTRNWLTA